MDFRYKYRLLLNNPVDDNVFAPRADDLVKWSTAPPDPRGTLAKVKGRVKSFGDTTGNIKAADFMYYPMNTTVWDIFQEMGLRHPGWIASPVPYGRRMTMFFGVPSQRYWSKPVPQSYVARMEKLRDSITQAIGEKAKLEGRTETLGDLVTEYVAGLNVRFKPFRSYHMASSQHNLVSNNIAASAYGVWNAVSVTYTKSDDADNSPLFSGSEGGVAAKRRKKKASGANWWETLEIKAHNHIPDEDILLESIDYFNCNGKQLATRYAVGSIVRGLKDMYKGNIILVGNARIKPYDVIFISDDYSGIAGPVEVEEVTHIFTPEAGFLSVVVPDAVVIANEAASFPMLVGLGGAVMLNLLAKRQRLDIFHPITDSLVPRASAIGLINTAAKLAKSYVGSKIVKQHKADPEKTRIGIQAASSTFGPTIVDTFMNMYNYYYWCSQEIAVNVVPLMKDGDPWVAGIPNDLFETQWDNFRGEAASALAHMARGRLDTILSAQLHGFQVATAYDGRMELKEKWRASKDTEDE